MTCRADRLSCLMLPGGRYGNSAFSWPKRAMSRADISAGMMAAPRGMMNRPGAFPSTSTTGRWARSAAASTTARAKSPYRQTLLQANTFSRWRADRAYPSRSRPKASESAGPSNHSRDQGPGYPMHQVASFTSSTSPLAAERMPASRMAITCRFWFSSSVGCSASPVSRW
jgi:hypothetical protein